MSGKVDLNEFVVGFVIESEEYLHSINRNLVAVSDALKQNRAEPRAVRELFRSLHTIKGLAAMVGAEPIVEIAHEMESSLRLAERAGGLVSEATLDLLLQGTRAIEERIQATSEKGVAGILPAPAHLLEALATSQNSVPKAKAQSEVQIKLTEEVLNTLSPSDREQLLQALSSGKKVVQIEFQPSADNTARGFNISSVRDRLGKLGEIIKVIPRSSKKAPTGIAFTLIVETQVDDQALSEASGMSEEFIQQIHLTEPVLPIEKVKSFQEESLEEWVPSDQSSVRVDIRRLDDVLEKLGELVITKSKLSRVASELSARGADTKDLMSVLAENNRQLKRLRGAITKARMVPLAELFQRLPLVVRGLTKNSDKSVNLVIQVGLAEVDKAVADKIFPAIVHLIRNSVDHAIETKAERKQAGKPETGTISVISDDSSGTNLVLTVVDDGRGIDREAIAKKSGRVVAEGHEDLLEQISMPGLSTQDNVTTTSGRGMGMNIVKTTVEMLGGQLSLKTNSTSGTTFTLRVPVSVTIVDVLLFVSGNQTFGVPVAMVDEIIEVNPERIVQPPSPSTTGAQTHLLQLRSETVPFLSLKSFLTQEGDETCSKALVINQQRGSAVAFGVDRMIGQQEVVVRPINDALVRIRGMAGATDLGDGRPTLVLDLATMGAALNQSAGMSL